VKKSVRLILAVVVVVNAAPAAAQVFPGASWEERTPEQVGLDPALVDQFVSSLGGDGVLIRNGYLVRKWGGYTSRADWASA
jgi:hypothetical protein